MFFVIRNGPIKVHEIFVLMFLGAKWFEYGFSGSKNLDPNFSITRAAFGNWKWWHINDILPTNTGDELTRKVF